MTDEDEFEGLFAQFDAVAESGESPPVASSQTNLTQSRAPSLGTRLVRWVLQGSGLMVAYLILFLGLIARPEELLADSLGLFLVVGLMSPLMGPRPLAHPFRWALLLATSSALAAFVAALVHWPTFLIQAPPVTALVLSLCEFTEKATNPGLVAVLTMFGILIWAMGRRLATANPWVETRSRWRRWRRMLGLSALGLLMGMVCTLPLLYSMTWNQAWIAAAHRPMPESQPQAFSAPGDLASIVTGQLAPTDFQPTQVASSLNHRELLEKMPLCASYLEQGHPLTVADLSLIEALMARGESEEPDPVIDRFLWATYVRAHRNELGLRGGTEATRMLRRTLLHRLCASPVSQEQLSLWGKRGEELYVLKPANRRGTDALFLEHLRLYRPGFPSPFLCKAQFHQPLRLFGVETPWTPASLSLEAERTLGVLIYSYRRGEIERGTPVAEVLSLPYTGSSFFDQPLFELFSTVTDELPYHYAADDDTLLGIILELKRIRWKTGRYPESYDIPDQLSYTPDGKTAQLALYNNRERGNFQYFHETLR